MGGQPMGRDWMPWLQLVLRGIARSPSPTSLAPSESQLQGHYAPPQGGFELIMTLS